MATRWLSWSLSCLALLPCTCFAKDKPTDTPVPVAMRGVWAKHGRCDLLGERLTITDHTARYGDGPSANVYYDPTFQPAIYWSEEGVVDNFVLGRTPDILIHNTQGFDMPGEEAMARCPAKLVKVHWPPK